MPDCFLIVVFDGLRRDHVTVERMPRLAAFVSSAFSIPRSRAVFPSATRVNASALSTGAPAVVNGLVANKFYDPALFPDRLIDTSDLDQLMEATGGKRPFLTAPTLGEMLGRAGLRMGVWSSASRGTTYLTHPTAHENGHVRICLHELAAGQGFAPVITDRFGPVPETARPNTARIDYLARLWLDALESGTAADVNLVWFNDPDLTYHYKGIDSAESHAALAGVDRAFGEFLDAIAARADADRFNVLVMSDHGQIVARERVDVADMLARNAISYDKVLADGVEIAGSLSSVGALRARDQAALHRAAQFLLDQPWVGAVFTRGFGGEEGCVPGTLNADLLMTGHARMPDLYYLMASDEQTSHGTPGGGPYLSDVPVGGGMHSGLNIHEINNVMALRGPRFREQAASILPGGTIDLAPTILHLLGLTPPATMLGRPLFEAMVGRNAEVEEGRSIAEISRNGRATRLERHHMGRTTYLAGLDTA